MLCSYLLSFVWEQLYLIQLEVHYGVQMLSSCGYLVSDYTCHVACLLPYSESLTWEYKTSFIFSRQALQVSSFQFGELKCYFRIYRYVQFVLKPVREVITSLKNWRALNLGFSAQLVMLSVEVSHMPLYTQVVA